MLIAQTPILQEMLMIAEKLPVQEQKSVLNYLKNLASQPTIPQATESQMQLFEPVEQSSNVSAGKFDNVFGMLKARKSVSLEDMDKAIAKRGAGL